MLSSLDVSLGKLEKGDARTRDSSQRSGELVARRPDPSLHYPSCFDPPYSIPRHPTSRSWHSLETACTMATATVSGTGSSASTGRNANAAGPSRRSPASPSALRPVERERDIWGLGLSSDLPPTPSPAPSQTHSRQPSLLRRRPLIPTNGDTGAQGQGHPLYRTDSPPRHSEDSYVEVLSDVSRPNLTRLTSDLERRAGSSRGNGSEEGSRKGSLDMLRMSTNEAQGGGEVEVLIHQVCPVWIELMRRSSPMSL